MNGEKPVIDYLNQLLAGELMARDQYFIHSRMYRELGYNKLFEHFNHEMEEETQHADALITRILMLGGTPTMQPEKLNVGKDVKSMLQADLAVELSVREALKQGIVLCEKNLDFVSRDLLLAQLKDTE
ncbi:MAG: bacterioferritin, partial [Neisseriaceae bacterium]|nr:bacterioferritin [Neisseriaceae bacterium]